MTNVMEGQVSLFDLDIWFGKTCKEHCPVTMEKTSESSSKKPRESQTRMPLFLDLRGGRGKHPGASWQMGGALLGEYTIRSFGAYPKEELASHLSQILTDNPHPKYYLSAKACQGILNRAEKRGKVLPEELVEILKTQSSTHSQIKGGVMTVNNGVASTLRASVGGHSEIVIEPRSKDGEPRINKGVSPTLNTSGGGRDSHV